ncbi:MAG: hypothetical protein ACREL1_04450 [bacterium]
MRSFYFYGPLFILGAGLWLKNGFGALVFGFLAVKSCLDDPFSFFFIWPVLIYEAQTAKNVLFKGYLKKTILFLAGCLGGTILGLVHDPWVLRKQTNYLHFGIAPFSQWAAHLKMLLEAWPLYWISALPWGYLQNSRLGLWLHPRSVNWIDGCVPIVFWILFLAVGIGSYFFCQKNFHERLLWWGPFGSFLAFFIFSQQTWDAMTLRYLGFGQMVLGIWLGLWAADASKHRWGKLWIVFLSLWIGFNAFFIARNLSGPARIHPGAYISERLEQLGIKAGFANYWVSETVRYFSQDQILIEPYNHSPISRKTLEAAQNSPKIGLIWLDGLDRPSAFPEIEKQLRSLNYKSAGRINFPGEGWRIFVWKKAPRPPVKSITAGLVKNPGHPPKDQI